VRDARSFLAASKRRDKHLDQLNAPFEQTGNTPQKNVLDQYALSQTHARDFSLTLVNDR
jgi:hypothetical protein